MKFNAIALLPLLAVSALANPGQPTPAPAGRTLGIRQSNPAFII